jgi:hypothetical protein
VSVLQPPIPASVFLDKLREARRLCATAKAEYKKIEALQKIYPSELADMHNGRRVMGLNTLDTVVLPQLGHEEQKAMHRKCGDQFLEDVDKALRSQLDPMLTSEYCQKLFTAIDADGSGAIDAEELRTALMQLKVFLTDDEAAAIVTELDVDRQVRRIPCASTIWVVGTDFGLSSQEWHNRSRRVGARNRAAKVQNLPASVYGQPLPS